MTTSAAQTNPEINFNLVEDLNILFVDIDNRDGRRQFRAGEKFFQHDTILWDFIHYYLPLKDSPEKIDALNIYDVLRANQMGYTHIVVDGKKWEQFTPSQQQKLIHNFKENVRRLKPQLLVVLGRKTYDELFKGEQPRIRGMMPVGFRPHSIKWRRRDKNTKRGDTKVFLMRKTRFKTDTEKNKHGKLLRSSFQKLIAFKEKYSGGSSSDSSKRKRTDYIGEDLSSYLANELQPYLESEMMMKTMSPMKKKMKAPSPDDESEEDQLDEEKHATVPPSSFSGSDTD